MQYINICGEQQTRSALSQNFGVEQIITKVHIAIFEQRMLFQSKELSKNDFINILLQKIMLLVLKTGSSLSLNIMRMKRLSGKRVIVGVQTENTQFMALMNRRHRLQTKQGFFLFLFSNALTVLQSGIFITQFLLLLFCYFCFALLCVLSCFCFLYFLFLFMCVYELFFDFFCVYVRSRFSFCTFYVIAVLFYLIYPSLFDWFQHFSYGTI